MIKFNFKLKNKKKKNTLIKHYQGFVFAENITEIQRYSHNLKKGNMVITKDGIGIYDFYDKYTHQVSVYSPKIKTIRRYHMTEVYQYFVKTTSDLNENYIPLSFSDYKYLNYDGELKKIFFITYYLTNHGFAKISKFY